MPIAVTLWVSIDEDERSTIKPGVTGGERGVGEPRLSGLQLANDLPVVGCQAVCDLLFQGERRTCVGERHTARQRITQHLRRSGATDWAGGGGGRRGDHGGNRRRRRGRCRWR